MNTPGCGGGLRDVTCLCADERCSFFLSIENRLTGAELPPSRLTRRQAKQPIAGNRCLRSDTSHSPWLHEGESGGGGEGEANV